MDLEIVGRHALLFDDDATAEVVNTGGSLVPWAAVGAADLLLDRHDVRHLLDRVPPRPRRSYSAALLSAPSPYGVSEAELDRERFLDLPADDGGDGDDGTRDAHPSGDEERTGQAGYSAVPFSYGSTADSDDPNSSDSYYRPSFYVPESLLNKLVNDWSRDEVPTSDAHCFLAMYLDVRSRQPPSEKVHQIIARTALFVSQHGGQSEIVLRVKQGSNPTFGFLMPDHHLHSYFRYLVDHPQLLKYGADAEDTDKDNKRVNTETEPAPSGGALSLLGTAYDSGDEEEGTVPANSAKNGTRTVVQGHGNRASILPDNEELQKDQTVTAESVGKTIVMKKNPVLTGNSFVAAQREKGKGAAVKSQDTKSGLTETKEMILEPPSFLKRTMEKIVEFILRNGKEFEEKLIDQDRTTGRFPFLLSSNPYHLYYLKMLQETQESKSRCRSPENKDRSPSERKDRRSSSHGKDIGHGKERSRSMERPTTGIDACAPDRSSAEPSGKQLREQQGKGKFEIVVGVKKEPPRKVTADEAAAIVMAATRGLSSVDDSRDTVKEMRDSVPTLVSNDRSSSFGSFSSLQGRDAPSKQASNSEADTSLTSSGQLKKEGTGIIDDDWIANTIAKAAAVAASKEADSSEATMTKEEKLKAERLRRAKMFAAIIKSGGSNMNNLATVADPSNESAKALHSDDMNALPPAAKEREGSSVPFEREGSIVAKREKDSDDEQNRVRKYRKKHYTESDEDKNDSEESYKPSRKRHRSEHSRGHSKDVHRHKGHSKDGESRHRRRQHSSSEDEHEHRSSKSRHRHRDRDHYDDDDYDYRRSRRHRRGHRSSSKRNYEDDRDQIEQTLGPSEASPRTSGPKIEIEKPPSDTAQSSGATEVSNDLRAKIRALLLETL